MISIDDALSIMNKLNTEPKTELISIFDVLGRILAEDIISKINMPPFDKSAMDGYAIIAEDTSTKFKVIEIVAAGKFPKHELNTGQCSKIMTGAPMPKGGDKVLKVELTKEKDGYMYPTGMDMVNNICYLGEDIKIGEKVLDSGIKLNASSVGVLASMGLKDALVYKKINIGLVTTGTEIVEPGFSLKNGQIYNSNAYSIYSQLKDTCAIINYAGIVGDNKESTKKVLAKVIDESDVIVISGGVSMGDFDFVPIVLKELGVKIHFDRVAIKPGRPTTFGTIGAKAVFGLPGNPVSTFVISEVFVKGMVYRMMGHKYNPVELSGILKTNYKRKKAGRASYIPVIYDRGIITIPEYHGSAHLGVLPKANALLLIGKGVDEIKEGMQVNVRQI